MSALAKRNLARVVVACAAVATVLAPAASAARDPFVVPVTAGKTGLGPFVEKPAQVARRARAAAAT